ncbi:MAG: hypothetical protein ACR65O_10765 [Methylomicrobium sp.]
MIDEVKDSINDNMKERLSSPILGSFLIFLISFHWKAIILLIWSEKKGIERIEELQCFMPNSVTDFIPAIIATFIYIISYPVAKLLYDNYLKFVERKQNQNSYENKLKFDVFKYQKDIETKNIIGDYDIKLKEKYSSGPDFKELYNHHIEQGAEIPSHKEEENFVSVDEETKEINISKTLKTSSSNEAMSIKNDILNTIKSRQKKTGRAVSVELVGELENTYSFQTILTELIRMYKNGEIEWEGAPNPPEALSTINIVKK